MALLSDNINKFALIRNARDTNHPDLLDISRKCLCFGANGITVHPRPDERHAKFSDLSPLKKLVNEFKNTEFNIEGYPTESFIEKVILVKPNQVTLVPDPPDAITSSFGWDCENNRDFLSKVIKKFQDNEIRVSIFISPSIDTLTNLKHIKPNRVELYTYDYAKNYESDNKKAIEPYLNVVDFLQDQFSSIELNAGHDLNLINLKYFLSQIPTIQEVSIGHAIVCDTFDFGLEQTIKKYLSLANN